MLAPTKTIMTIQLRPYQVDAEDDVRTAFMEGARAVILTIPTGGGKTVIFSKIVRGAAERGNPSLIIAHRDALIKQASRKLSEYGVDHGIIMARYTPRPYAPAQVASIQTLIRRISKRPEAFQHYKLVVIDEAHLSMANSYRTVVDLMPNAKILGVTGTPSRLDGKGLGTHAGGFYDQLILGPSIPELIAQGHLVRPVVYGPLEQLDLSEVNRVRGDYDESQLAEVVDKPTITGSAVEHYKRICPDVPAVAWCVNLKHAEHVAAEFNAAGVAAVVLKGDHTGEERDAAMAALASGQIKVVAFCQLLVEGVDCPAIGCIIILRPTYSLTSTLQVIGRGLRPDPANPAKTVCYVLDHAGLTFRHGFADEEREWSLDGIAKKPKKPKDKNMGDRIDIAQCVNCFHVFQTQPTCPNCGTPVPKRERTIEHVDGELDVITPEMVAARKKERRIEIAQAKTLDELKKLAEKYGYKPGWADVKWGFKKKARDRFRGNREAEWESRIAAYQQYQR